MKKLLMLLIGAVMLISFSGCEEDTNYDALMAEEERYFDLYMDARYPDVAPIDGLYYIEYQEGEGASPDTGDYVLINYLAYTIPDETVVDTYNEEWARDYNLYNSEVLYGPYKYKHGTEMEGLKRGISMMKEGGIARILFKSDLGYGADGLGQIGRFESLMYDIELLEVIDSPAVREQEMIDAYLADHPTAYGITDEETGKKIYHIPETTGDSVFVKSGNTVEVFYTGTLLDGREFDSNTGDNAGLKVVVGEGDVIRGWDLGLTYFRYGGKGKLLIPHELAYGEDGSTAAGTNKTSIPPYEALLFDIEVTKKVYDIKEN